MVSGTLKHIPVETTVELVEGYCPQGELQLHGHLLHEQIDFVL